MTPPPTQNKLSLLQLMAAKTDAALVITDVNSRILHTNQGFSRRFGWTLSEVRTRRLWDVLRPDTTTEYPQHMLESLRAGLPLEAEEIIKDKEGNRYWVSLTCTPVIDDTGRWQYTIYALLDITKTKVHEVLNNRVLEAMAREMPLVDILNMVCEEVERIAPEISASILQVDEQGRLHPLAGPSLPHSYSVQLEGVAIGPKVGSCGTAAWRKQSILVTDIATDPLWEDYKHLVLPLGYTACWSTPLMKQDGTVLGTFAFYYREYERDIASSFHYQLVQACAHLCTLAMGREEARLRIRRLAFYDALTGLPNRNLLQTHAEELLRTAQRKACKAAVLFIDLDRFKHVNDSLGHAAGDTLLCAMAERLRHALPPHGIAGRLSGDEFVAVLPEPDDGNIGTQVERLQKSLMQPMTLGSTTVGVSVSIGVAVHPQDGSNIETLLQRADIALYQAKHAGRSCFSFFSPEMNRQAQERLLLEHALRQTLLQDDGSLHLHYQPQISLGSGKIYGIEALARWQHPDFGAIPPSRFIPLAEECGLISQLGQWSLREACHQLHKWHQQGLRVPSVAVNLSSLNFYNLDLPEVIIDILRRYSLQPFQLTVELTESVLLDTNHTTMKTLEAMEALGIRFSMDDFGSGYSSLSYLRRLPISELKLDRSFVADLEHDEAARALSSAILGIGKSLNLTVVAEGVETTGQNETLRAQGYPVVQGYLFSRPLPATDLAHWLQAATI